MEQRHSARLRNVFILSAGLALAGAGVLARPAHAATATSAGATTVLGADVLPGLSLVTPTGPAPAGQTLSIGVGLALPNQQALSAYQAAESDPSSPDYRHFLTPSQFDARFGVAPSTYQSVTSWLQSGGLTISQTTGAGDWVEATGTVAQLESLFHVAIDSYSLKGVSFVANTNAPTVPSSDSIITVVGLNTLQRFSTPSAPTASAPSAGSGPSVPGCLPACDYNPSDLWSMYDMPSTNKGEGQTMAIFGGGRTDDVIANLRDFEAANKLSQVPVTVSNVGPGPFTDDSGQTEWDLDTQASTGMAPNVQGETLYFAKDIFDASVESAFTQWAQDPNGPLQANASFGECETNPTNPVTGPLAQQSFGTELGDELEPVAEQTLQQATVEGRTLFASAGDTGSSCPVLVLPVVGAGNGLANQAVPLASYPCASDFAVCVGGTTLYSDGNTPPSRAIEKAWEFTGGGSALFQAEPSFQKDVSAVDIPCVLEPSGTAAYPSGTICRGAPDVASMSGDVTDNAYNFYDNGAPGTEGGTSLSSPLWVGMWTRIQAAAPALTEPGPNGTTVTTYPGLGFADPVIYKVGENAAQYASDFFDVTIGDNGYYHAAPGWDYVSGWGVPDVANLMQTLDGTQTPTNNVPVPPVSGPTPVACPLLWQNPSHTATDTFGNSDPQLSLVNGEMALSPDGKTLQVTLAVNNLSASVPPGATAEDWYATWTYNGTEYFAQAQLGALPISGPTFADGTVQLVGASHDYSPANTDTGQFNPGANGTIVIDVPLANVGAPPSGSTLTQPAGQTYVEVGIPPNPAGSAASLQPVDSGGPTNNFAIGTGCMAAA